MEALSHIDSELPCAIEVYLNLTQDGPSAVLHDSASALLDRFLLPPVVDKACSAPSENNAELAINKVYFCLGERTN